MSLEDGVGGFERLGQRRGEMQDMLVGGNDVLK